MTTIYAIVSSVDEESFCAHGVCNIYCCSTSKDVLEAFGKELKPKMVLKIEGTVFGTGTKINVAKISMPDENVIVVQGSPNNLERAKKRCSGADVALITILSPSQRKEVEIVFQGKHGYYQDIKSCTTELLHDLDDILDMDMDENEQEMESEEEIHTSKAKENAAGDSEKKIIAAQVEDDEDDEEDEEDENLRLSTILLLGEVSSGKSSFLNAMMSDSMATTGKKRHARNTWHRFPVFTKTADLLGENPDKPRGDDYTLLPGELRGTTGVVDLPGIDDTVEKDNEYMEIVIENIHNANMVIYFTSADKAFQQISDVERFGRIKSLVDAEIASGRDVKLFVVVNKYDQLMDADLAALYSRIPERIGLPASNIVRVSSHKMMISNLIRNKSELMFLKSDRGEIAKILKTANITITQSIKESIQQNGKIMWDQLEYGEDLFDDIIEIENTSVQSSESLQKNDVLKSNILQGDWDNFMSTLATFSSNHNDDCVIDTMLKRFDKWAAEAASAYVVSGNIRSLSKEFTALLHRSTTHNIPVAKVQVAIIGAAAQLTACPTLLIAILQTLLGCWHEPYAHLPAEYMLFLVTILERLPYTLFTFALCISLQSRVKCPDSFIRVALCHAFLYNSGATAVKYISDFKSGTISTIYPQTAPAQSKYGASESWAIRLLLEDLPMNWKRLLRLAITPAKILRSYVQEGLIDYKICDELIAPGFERKLRYLLDSADYAGSSTPLNHMFFSIDNYVGDYIKERESYLQAFPL
jgi:GTPase SAR1 family protein